MTLSFCLMYNPILGLIKLQLAMVNHFLFRNIGNKCFTVSSNQFYVRQVFHIPNLTSNLVSVSKFYTDNHAFFKFYPTHFLVKDQHSNRILFQGSLKGCLYTLSPTAEIKNSYAFITTRSPARLDKYPLWHSRLRHLVVFVLHQGLKAYSPSVHLSNSNKISYSCSFCPLAKSHKLPFPLSPSQATDPLQLLHMDLWEPACNDPYQIIQVLTRLIKFDQV